MKEGSLRFAARVFAGVLTAMLLLGGCAGVRPGTDPAPGTASGDTASASGSPSPTDPSRLTQLVVGECTGPVSENGEPTTTITAIDCSSKHSWEVAAIVPLTASDYPGEDALKTQAATECAAAFADYVGVEVAASPYSATFVAPGESSWANPDARRLACLVGTGVGGLTRSLKNHPVVFAEVGQCLGEPDGTTYPLVACSDKHLYEVYAEARFTTKAAPTDAQVDRLYTRTCLAAFTKFVGVALGKSKYEIQYFVLPETLWKKYSDHRIVCSVGLPSGGITGTLKGAKK